MVEIRPLERSDMAAVTRLLRAEMPGWELREDVLAASVIDHPWNDPETPSLVAVGDDGSVVGFIGAQARRMRFGERAIRGVCCTQLTVAAEHRAGATGALLLRRMVSGPQEVTWSDSSTDVVLRLWEAFGGHLDHARAADFMLVLRPLQWVGRVIKAKLGGGEIGRRLVPVQALPAGERFTSREPVTAAPGVEGAEATPAEVAAALPDLSRHLEVHVEWDEEELGHVLKQVGAIEEGVSCRMVRREGRVIGWYAYLRRPGEVSRVLHLAAAKRAADDVLADLIADATENGSAVLAGRAEPHLESALRRRHATLELVRQPTVRAADPALAAALGTGASLLTRLEGEVFAA